MLLPTVWKMLNHMHLTFATSVMADGIAWWQMEWPLQGDLADVICHGPDVTLILVLRG